MNPTVAGLRRPQTLNTRQALLAAVAIAAVLAGAMAASDATRLPSFVGRVSVQNPTPFHVEVEVARPQRDGWLSLGGVRRESTKQMYEVIDQGERWVFRFSYGGEAAGEVTLPASQLRSSGWRVMIPVEVGDRLRAEGLTPSA